MTQAWANATTENGGRGYGALDLEQVQSVDICAKVEAKLPGLQAEIETALREQKALEDKLAGFRLRIQAELPGDAVNVVMTACRKRLLAPQKATPKP